MTKLQSSLRYVKDKIERAFFFFKKSESETMLIYVIPSGKLKNNLKYVSRSESATRLDLRVKGYFALNIESNLLNF